jgi:hypothetical protein
VTTTKTNIRELDDKVYIDLLGHSVSTPLGKYRATLEVSPGLLLAALERAAGSHLKKAGAFAGAVVLHAHYVGPPGFPDGCVTDDGDDTDGGES